ncbi:MAG: cobalt-precorrin-6A reductase [Alphaproteobacteria bacterium]|nr:cobalt-precorrin-6A reductase [Alphaproteobacteria bacterium]|tara:strand:- start:1124 stop:1888 length:765 start_codon:yes stop_codon:yes gene_type:complete
MSSLDRPTVLILGGTAEAVALAEKLVGRWGDAFEIVTSLAGRTSAPVAVRGAVRTGGFGGAAPMTTYLRDHRVCAVLDATHPFAVGISENARIAAEAANVPRIALVRPNWTPEPGERWHMVPDITAAARALPHYGRRAFLTTGRTELDAFSTCSGVWFLVRLIERPDAPLPLADHKIVLGRGPFTVAQEQDVMENHKIDVLVCKASGGEATRAKLSAAKLCDIPVVMIERPVPSAGEQTQSVEGVAEWFAAKFG